MPYSDRLSRRAERQQAAHGIGRDSRLPRYMHGQLRADLALAEILSRASTKDPLFQNDAADPSKLLFVPGVSLIGGPDRVP